MSGPSIPSPRPGTDAASWETRYREGRTPWTLSGPPPALVRLLASQPPGRRHVYVPGAGTGHDALAWAAAGHDVTAVDHAPTALTHLRTQARRLGLSVQALELDVLQPPARLESAFDIVWEHTCFCAVDPHQRAAYVRAMAHVLGPGGLYHGLFRSHGRPGGPPWDVSESCVLTHFHGEFRLVGSAPVDSAPARSDEFMVTLRRRLPPRT